MREKHTPHEVLKKLQEKGKLENREGMARFGIDTSTAYGVSMPDIRSIGSTIIKDHQLAEELWQCGIHEARILASLVDISKEVTREQMDRWVSDFSSWDVCDQVCGNLFDRTSHAESALRDWASDKREFVKRAAFALVAWRAVHLKNATDDIFLAYLPLIETAAGDDRNFVRKAVNWALRQIGKRNRSLHAPALELSNKLANLDIRSARWIGQNAAKELNDPKIKTRLGIRN